jgi:hypothetical protein
MSMDNFQIGDRVRAQGSGTGIAAGEEGQVLDVQRDAQGSMVSVTLLLDSNPQATRGTTVYLRDAVLEKVPTTSEPQGSTEQDLAEGEDEARALGDQPA